MLIIPAIDLKEGRCVRLRQGRMEEETVFSDDPLAIARRWAEAGARRLHLVDLDGAFAGRPRNAAVVHAVAAALPDLPIQLGGGIRDRATASAYIEAGVRWLIIGTRAAADPPFVEALCAEFPGQILVGLDARDGMAATDGWARASGHSAVDLARRFAGMGVEAIIHTDIGRDGMLQGVNAEASARLAEQSGLPVIASGGVTDLGDIEALRAVAGRGVVGAVVGRAIYAGTLDFAAAQRLADSQGAAERTGNHG